MAKGTRVSPPGSSSSKPPSKATKTAPTLLRRESSLEEEMVGLVGDLRRSRLARAQQNGKATPAAAAAAPLTIPAEYRRATTEEQARLRACAVSKWLLTSGVQPELSPPGSPDGDGAADLLASASAAPLRAHRLDFGATPFDATPFDASAAAPALCQPAQTPATQVGALCTAASVGTAATAVATTPAYCGRAAMATPGVGGTPPSAKDSPTAAPEPAPEPAPGASSPAFDGKGGADASAAVELFCGARAPRRRRPRPRPPATTGPSCRPAERPAAVAAGGRGGARVSPAATTPGHGARHRRRRSRRRRPRPRSSTRTAHTRSASGCIGGRRRWAPRSATAARRSTRRRRPRPSASRRGACSAAGAACASTASLKSTKSCRREIASVPLRSRPLRSRPLVTAPLPLAPPQAVCEWRVGALLRGGDVLSPNRSVLRRWGNSMTARTFGAWRKYTHEVAREKVSTAELTMRRWLQWRVSRALQRWLDGVTFLSEQQRLAKKATKSWKAGGVSHGWRRWRDATEPRHRRAARRAFQRRLPIGRAWQRWNDAIRSRHSHGLAALKLAASAWCERKDMLMKWQARSSPPHPRAPSSLPPLP